MDQRSRLALFHRALSLDGSGRPHDPLDQQAAAHNPMKSSKAKIVKLPKAAVMFADPNSLDFKYGMTVFSKRHKKYPHFTSPVVIIACRNRQEAREIVRLRGMSGADLVRRVFRRILNARETNPISFYPMPTMQQIEEVLQALHLIP